MNAPEEYDSFLRFLEARKQANPRLYADVAVPGVPAPTKPVFVAPRPIVAPPTKPDFMMLAAGEREDRELPEIVEDAEDANWDGSEEF